MAQPGEVVLPTTDGPSLPGTLTVPDGAVGLVVFAHGSGSSRHSPRNLLVAERLHAYGLGTLRFDLLSADEADIDERTGALRFDIHLLGERVRDVVRGLRATPTYRKAPIGLFGASTGAAAALYAAADPTLGVRAVVSRGGRPDLADAVLPQVGAPTLLVVGGRDRTVLELNHAAGSRLGGPYRIEVVPGATHLFAEPGTLEQVADLAGAWFRHNLGGAGESAHHRGFTDRRAAGRELGAQLRRRVWTDPLVLGLARGGVPVAWEIAQSLGAPLDVEVARKIGAPDQPEFGVGAVAADGPPYFDKASLDSLGLSAADLAEACERERAEAHRRLLSYRPAGTPAPVEGRTVILVDDGLATGVTARAAIAALRRRGAGVVVFAAPVCAADAAAALRSEADEVVCVGEPSDFQAVGVWYADFGQVSDDEVRKLLADPPAAPAGRV